MVAAPPSVLRRDEAAKLDRGAIAGIACAIGALFLGSVVLFLIYWRRQKRLSRPVSPRQRPSAQSYPPPYSPPIYTHDYKIGHDSVLGGSGSSARTFSPEFPKETVFYLPPEPASVSASAMPTHPAYVPRALIRPRPPSPPADPVGVTAPRPPIALQPAPKPQPKAARGTKTRPDDLMMQAFLRAADGERVPSEVFNLSGDSGRDRRPTPLASAERAGNYQPLRDEEAAWTQAATTTTTATFTTTSPTPAPHSVPGLRSGTLARAHPLPPRLFIDTGQERRGGYVRDLSVGISAPNDMSSSAQAQRPPNPAGGPADHGRYHETSRNIESWMAGQSPFQPRLQLPLSQPRPKYRREEVACDNDVWG